MLRVHNEIVKNAITLNSNKDFGLGKIEVDEDSNDVNLIVIRVTPCEGFHKDIQYILKLNFKDINNWPDVFINSCIFDQITTNQYKINKGYSGEHHGICIKDLGYGYSFNKYFKVKCNNKWYNYLILLISTLNDLNNIGEKGNGIRHDFKKIIANINYT